MRDVVSDVSNLQMSISDASSLTGPTGGWGLPPRSWQVGVLHISKNGCLVKLSAVLRLAVAAMFLGIQQSSLLLPLPWSTHVLVAYVAWLATFRLLLLLHKHFYAKIRKRASEHFISGVWKPDGMAFSLGRLVFPSGFLCLTCSTWVRRQTVRPVRVCPAGPLGGWRWAIFLSNVRHVATVS